SCAPRCAVSPKRLAPATRPSPSFPVRTRCASSNSRWRSGSAAFFPVEGTHEPGDRPRAARPAPTDEAVTAVHIGTSGWSYDHWQGVLYPPDTLVRERLDYYLRRFQTVEVNATYYRWPPDT